MVMLFFIVKVYDCEMVFEDGCSEYQMPKDIIRVAIKDNKKTGIYNLEELKRPLHGRPVSGPYEKEGWFPNSP